MAKGMPWIRAYTNIRTDPRSLILGRLLGDAHAYARILDLRLWLADNAPDGVVRGPHAEVVVEEAVGWRGEPGAFAKAARDSGFLVANSEGLSDVDAAAWLRGQSGYDPYDHPIRIRLKTPEERAEAAAEHARIIEATRQRTLREQAHREEMRAAKRAAARVYFIQQDGGDRLVKIGTTTRPVEVRLKELQAGQPHPLVILAHAPGAHYEEGRLHDRFGPHCVTGEWFRPHADVLAYAAVVGKAGVL